LNTLQTHDSLLGAVSVHHLRAYLTRHGWTEEKFKLQDRKDVIPFHGPQDKDHLDVEGKRLVLFVPASKQRPDFSSDVQEVINALRIIEGRRADDILHEIVGPEQAGNGHPTGETRSTAKEPCLLSDLALHEHIKQMALGRASQDHFLREVEATINHAIRSVIRDRRQLAQEREDLTQEARRHLIENIRSYAFDRGPVRSWVYVVVKRSVIDWLRKHRKEETIPSHELEILIQDSVTKCGWEDIDELYRAFHPGKKNVEEQLAVLGLKYVEGDTVEETVIFNLTYAGTVAYAAHLGPPILEKLQQVLPTKQLRQRQMVQMISERISEAAGRIADLRPAGPASLSYPDALDKVWSELSSLGELAGFSPRRKTLLVAVGAKPKTAEPKLDLSGSGEEIRGRERRRIHDFLDAAETWLTGLRIRGSEENR
jgi:RNA polymerase sigma factor (sigma-70 family)